MLSLKPGQKLKSDIKIKEPKTAQEYKEYFKLRWKILREPWAQPKGSEKDNKENESYHKIAVINNKIVGCGRGHFNSGKQAQIRYMAIHEKFRRSGIATKLLDSLERTLIDNGAEEIILKSRLSAISLYLNNGYKIFKKGDLLFGEIEHFWMKKKIKKSPIRNSV